tara:strand:+ start:791 stop:1039 length:249 start_codon:yes stop_codon:yes gene_type:complete
MPLMPMLGITNIPEAKAHKNKKVKKQIKKCFGIKPTKVTADMYFNKEKYKGKPCKKVRNHHRSMHAHNLFDRIKNDPRFPNH